ncbi:hypothetical protein DCAR_0519085 [Daucus carota subsp. sativus]|uniref:Vacuolar iron transporter n=1 Tax=Daucus carota subsp. sativus TaxID=79200 RepID=A0A164XPY9_DAUCS|nr:PREDICTED: vacuolar iron transporter homolog 2-like [Daucus carota subsp. sativus]WOG99730.1 hypothetical protein DCAR_0519085 [Daucus carota subsp. sativus]
MTSAQTVEIGGKQELSVVEKAAESLKRLQRGQWIRAAVLGANDGLLSTTSLMLGVGAAKEDQWSMVLSGLAGAIAGACSMAVGEFVSVSTQRDIEGSLNDECNSREKHDGDVEIKVTPITNPSLEETKHNVFGMSPSINHPSSTPTPHPNYSNFLSPARSPMMKIVMSDARKSTVEEPAVMSDDRNERLPNPYKAAAASAVSFLSGSFFPLMAAILVHDNVARNIVVVIVASIALALFGVIGAFLGGSSIRLSALRVLLGGWIAMGVTYGLLKPWDKDDKAGKDKSLHND